MSPTIALFCQIAIPLLAGLAVTFYLRNVTRKLLLDLCGTDDRANFWQRTTNILILGAPLAMVFFFGDNISTGSLSDAISIRGGNLSNAVSICTGNLPDALSLTRTLRQTVKLSLIGILIAVALFSRGVWKQIPALSKPHTNGEA